MIPHRKPNRLPNYNYSKPWWYFVTICTKDKIKWFGEIDKGEMVLNQFEQTVSKFWQDVPKKFPNVEIDEFTIMPNHIHGIIIINPNIKSLCSNTNTNLSNIIKWFKSRSSIDIHNCRGDFYNRPNLGELKFAPTELNGKNHFTITSSAMKFPVTKSRNISKTILCVGNLIKIAKIKLNYNIIYYA